VGKDRWGGGRFGRKPKIYISVYSVSLCFQMTRGLGGFLKHRGTEAQREEEWEGGGRGAGEGMVGYGVICFVEVGTD